MIDVQTRQLALTEAEREHKSAGIAYAFWFFLGIFGAHRYYVGDKGLGTGQLLTLGGLAIWSFVDVFFIGARVKEFNKARDEQFIRRYEIAASGAQIHN